MVSVKVLEFFEQFWVSETISYLINHNYAVKSRVICDVFSLREIQQACKTFVFTSQIFEILICM